MWLNRIAPFLKRLAKDNPKLDVRILCWRSALPVAATQHWFPIADRKTFAGSEVKFVLDGKLPTGASHHQKAIVIDDAISLRPWRPGPPSARAANSGAAGRDR